MRITFAGPVPPLRGGIAQHGACLVRALRELGHLVTVISWAAQYPRLLYRGPQRDPAAAPEAAQFSLRWWQPGSWWRAGRQARGGDLLVLPWVTPFHAVACRVLTGAARPTPALAVVHNALPHEPMPLARTLTRLGLRGVQGALVHSRQVAQDLDALVALPQRCVPHPANLELHAAPLPEHPPLRLLFLGFVRPYKGLDVAIEALAQLARAGHDVTLTVAGEFWEPVADWQQRIRAAGLQARVRLIDRYVADAEVQPLLDGHHALLAPYRTATQSGVVPLALAAGRPVIASDAGGLAEVVQEGVNGCLAAAGDAAGLASAILRAGAELERLAGGAARSAPRWRDVAVELLALARELPAR